MAVVALRAHDRSIPACTGEPFPAAVTIGADKVYPRVYGGTEPAALLRNRQLGLSPRVRGNQAARAAALVLLRPIPACTGEPSSRRVSSTGVRVYPRVYGGTVRAKAGAVSLEGLSPRVRGNRSQPGQEQVRVGSIPACTGEPSPANPRQ